MKKLLTFAVALFALSFVSCTEGDFKKDCSLDRPEFACDVRYEKEYTYVSKIYISDESMFFKINEETMLEVGAMRDGKVVLTLPENVDSRFLEPAGMYAEPSNVEVWFYKEPLRLVAINGSHTEDLVYQKGGGNETEYHRIYYWYFSKDAKISETQYNSETDTYECVYNIDAKKGWNKVYFYTNIAEGKICYTTDLNKAPDDLRWLAGPQGYFRIDI
ncbi:MAG: hypothetical protein LBU89_03165 [Fibromonadaceae bacterium]|jgi:hypothetical protein|nr:hypothetical protein [Fibromonadaceae bacterium]